MSSQRALIDLSNQTSGPTGHPQRHHPTTIIIIPLSFLVLLPDGWMDTEVGMQPLSRGCIIRHRWLR